MAFGCRGLRFCGDGSAYGGPGGGVVYCNGERPARVRAFGCFSFKLSIHVVGLSRWSIWRGLLARGLCTEGVPYMVYYSRGCSPQPPGYSCMLRALICSTQVCRAARSPAANCTAALEVQAADWVQSNRH
eukprot:612210-Prymnesium_polylepis.1